ncbi:hypothetical protein [Acinetobacter sp. NIPH 2100]|uniref:hypothetical protein n=1 Tax=Acinetobacter sp. NIPH 2100 TaxID=1217708 RepID=UPI0002CDF164|nr:hypothetical protein [Acinetobacter sp. NIPH 2100]ENX41525.1 hypothetical protein F887_01921 [Acinetobacter sp. NIPH 2100]
MKKSVNKMFVGVLLSTIAFGCFGGTNTNPIDEKNNQEAGNKVEEKPKDPEKTNNPFPVVDDSDGKSSFMGLGLGIGVEQYRQGNYIDTATTNGTDRIVSIDKEYRTVPSLWFTANWSMAWRNFVNKEKDTICGQPVNDGNVKVCYGGFVGAKLFDANATSSLLRGFAIGPQVTFKTKNRSYSLGVGWVNHQTKKLASGIEDGKPLPSQFSDIKYREQSENSYMLMFSTNLIEK